VDAIVAEDIAEFPDLNLAESLQRIPGVAINRTNGEGSQITVRGAGGKRSGRLASSPAAALCADAGLQPARCL
jgi:outer membrane receptor for Fe3+-dicitrate